MEVRTLAIVGRPNVGKSALFNRLVGRKIAIVHDQPGVTRDRIAAPFYGGDYEAIVIDTGGMGSDSTDNLAARVAEEAETAIAAADFILFVCDSRDHLTPMDRVIAQQLHESKLPVLLVLNKADTEAQELALGEFMDMGFEHYVFTSAAHGRGLNELRHLLNEELRRLGATPVSHSPEVAEGDAKPSEEAAPEDTAIRMAIVGRPNAGKSSLVNAILRDNRTIVSEQAGTTRDAVDIPYRRGEQDFVLIDTAGMRPRSKRDTSVEVFSAMRSERAIRRSDVCLLVIDCEAGITRQDIRIAAIASEEKKPCVIVLNKSDLFCPDEPMKKRRAKSEAMVREHLFFSESTLMVCVSAKTGSGLTDIFAAVEKLRKNCRRVPSTGELNRVLQKLMEESPPARVNGRRLKLYYATVAFNEKYMRLPVPTYVLFVNDKTLMSESYARFLRSAIYAHTKAEGVPVVLSLRSRVRTS